MDWNMIGMLFKPSFKGCFSAKCVRKLEGNEKVRKLNEFYALIQYFKCC